MGNCSETGMHEMGPGDACVTCRKTGKEIAAGSREAKPGDPPVRPVPYATRQEVLKHLRGSALAQMICLDTASDVKFVEPPGLRFLSVEDLARAIFDSTPAVRQDALRRVDADMVRTNRTSGEERAALARVLDVMWSKTKPAEREAALAIAKAVWDSRTSE